jgi:hypothetical protein
MSQEKESDKESARKFVELVVFHDQNEEHAKMAAQLADDVESTEKRLRRLAERWAAANAKPRSLESNQSKEDETESVGEGGIVHADGSPFVLEDELSKLEMLKGKLQLLPGELALSVRWLQEVKDRMRQQALPIHYLVSSVNQHQCYFVFYYFILAEAGAAYDDYQSASDFLWKAANLLSSLDVSSEMLRSDVVGARRLPKFLELALDMVKKAAATSRQASSRLIFSGLDNCDWKKKEPTHEGTKA